MEKNNLNKEQNGENLEDNKEVIKAQKKEKKDKRFSWWQRLLIVLGCVVLCVVLVLGGYVAYLSIQFYRIEDNAALAVENNQQGVLTLGQELSIATYNIGFGAYSQDFSFFMDSGKTLTGKTLQGTGSRAKNKDTVLYNTNGALSVVDNNYDFMFFQEVDTNSHRSYKVNQLNLITSKFGNYSCSFASNFHSGYLFYPLTNPHGSVSSGIATLSKYNITSATRRSLPIDMGFVNKFFDLDRCFSVSRLKIDGTDKELVLINVHLSAYDEGGKVRAEQLEVLNGVLADEYQKGNYVVAGGDFNHDIAGTINSFTTNREVPDWVYELNNSNLAENFTFAASNLVPTCRSTDAPYVKNESYTVTLDGFIVSDNIEVISVENIDTDFVYSDHNPATMKFRLI